MPFVKGNSGRPKGIKQKPATPEQIAKKELKKAAEKLVAKQMALATSNLEHGLESALMRNTGIRNSRTISAPAENQMTEERRRKNLMRTHPDGTPRIRGQRPKEAIPTSVHDPQPFKPLPKEAIPGGNFYPQLNDQEKIDYFSEVYAQKLSQKPPESSYEGDELSIDELLAGHMPERFNKPKSRQRKDRTMVKECGKLREII